MKVYEKIRAQADIASRVGQYDALMKISEDVRAMENELELRHDCPTPKLQAQLADVVRELDRLKRTLTNVRKIVNSETMLAIGTADALRMIREEVLS